jgi:hypothetical protein
MQGCPDCDPEGFRRRLVETYGEPVEVNGFFLYADPQMPKHGFLDIAAFARRACPAHAPRTEQAKDEP